MSKRSRGTGSLYTRKDAAGRESWYGRVHVNGARSKRMLGRKREPGGKEGLTRSQAEKALRDFMAEQESAPARARERMTVGEAGERYLRYLTADGRKRSTLEGYESYLRVHLAPYFDGWSLESVTPEHVDQFIQAKLREGKSRKSVLNWVGLLHSIYAYGSHSKRGWVRTNPVKDADKPRHRQGRSGDIRFLEMSDVEAVLRAVPAGALGATERVLYLVAAMTGLRQGELFGLRWRDIDWAAGKVRVRQAYVRGEIGTPKSLRGTRAVPLADRAMGELERHYQGSQFQGDDDLVFPHPLTGAFLDRSKVLKRYKAALLTAGAGQFELVVNAKGETIRKPLTRFHDLRHTFGTRMAAAGVPMRTLQEWMGHEDAKTTAIYADYAPSAHERAWVESAFGGSDRGAELSETEVTPANGKSL